MCLIKIGPELTTNCQHKDESHILFWKCPWLLMKQLLTAQKKTLNIWVSLSSCCRYGKTGCLCIFCTPHTFSCVCSEDLAHDAAEVQESLEEKLSMVAKWSSSLAHPVNPSAPANGHAVKRKRAETPGREGRWWRAWSLGVCVECSSHCKGWGDGSVLSYTYTFSLNILKELPSQVIPIIIGFLSVQRLSERWYMDCWRKLHVHTYYPYFYNCQEKSIKLESKS